MSDGTYRGRWIDEVFRTSRVSAEVQVFLLFLGCRYMAPDGRVSEPRWLLAQGLGCYERRINDRFEAAIRGGLMARVSRGQKGRTAVYRATMPGSQEAGHPPAEPESQGASQPPAERSQGAGHPPAEAGSAGGLPAPHIEDHRPAGDQRDGGVVVALFNGDEQRSLRSQLSRTRASAPASGEHPAFAEWYDAFPVHKARGAAVKAFTKAAKKADPETLIAAAKRYRDDPQVQRGYAKHPATWLNQECWLDEPADSTPAADPRQRATNDRYERAMQRAIAREEGR